MCTLHIEYIFLNVGLLQTFFQNVCIYPGLKYKTFNFALQLSIYFFACFYIICVC